MRVLVVTPFAPRADAPHGGARALATNISTLAERHEIGLVHLRDAHAVGDDVRARVAFAEELPGPAVGGARRLAVYAGLLRGTPVAVAERVGAATARRLGEIVERWRPDVVQFEFLLTASLVAAVGASPKILVDHDATLRPIEGFDHLAAPLRRVLRRLDRRAWSSLAGRTAAGVDVAIVFTERDRGALKAFADVRVVPLVATPRHTPLDARGAEPGTILFTGYYRHPPNTDAAAWLVDEIYPRVRAQQPDARLALVGDELPAAVRARAGEGVDMPGRVETVDPYLERAAVVVAPLRTGGGTRVKVLEALGAGKAVVATPLALEGIDAPDGEAVVVASSAAEIADAIVALLRDPVRRSKLGAAAYAWACAELDPRTTADRFDDIYDDLVPSR